MPDIRSFFKTTTAPADSDSDEPSTSAVKKPKVIESSDEDELDGAPSSKAGAVASVKLPPAKPSPAPSKPSAPLVTTKKAKADDKEDDASISSSSPLPKKRSMSIPKPLPPLPPPAVSKKPSILAASKKKPAKSVAKADEDDNDGDDDDKNGESSPLKSKAHEDDDSSDEEDDDDDQSTPLNLSSPLKVGSASQIAALPSKFDPTEPTTWTPGQPVPYSALVAVFEKVEATSKRLEIQEALSRFFRQIIRTTPGDLIHAVYLCCNTVTPAFEGVELGIGEALLKKAIVDSTGRSRDAIESLYKDKGDLGIVAQEARKAQPTLFGFKPNPLTLADVRTNFLKIAKTQGNKSQDVKVGIIKKMLGACSGVEAKFIVRGLQGKLRIGLAEQSVLVALAHAVCLTPPTDLSVQDLRATLRNDAATAARLDEAVKLIKQVYSECPSYDEMIPALLSRPLTELKEACHITAGVPLKPMLAKPTKGVSEVLDRFSGGRFTCEFKYDGERAQIHRLEDGTIRIFSRNSEDNSTKYPDVVRALEQATAAATSSFILDSEVVAYSRQDKRMLPFQVLSTRARKDVASTDDVKVQVIVCAFDLLFLNGMSLLTEPLAKRREMLRSAFVEVPDLFTFAVGADLTDPEEILGFLHQAVNSSCEGLMVKTLDDNATYEPSKRSLNWLKVKKDYMDNMTDSLDLVVVGAFEGRGKRTGVFGAFLLACYDPDAEEFQTVCKIGTGFSEKDLEEHSARLKALPLVPGKPKNVESDMECDVWFEPHLVWEVKAADLSISPVHKAARGLVHAEKGIALRFPRFLRVREDKAAEDATTSEQVAHMYQSQAVVSGGKMAVEDDD